MGSHELPISCFWMKMSLENSRKEILLTWLQAAESFSNSQEPNVGHFSALTGRVSAHADHCEDLALAVHVVEEIAGTRSTTNSDKVDRVLLRSRMMTTSLRGHSKALLQECVKERLVPSEAEGNERLDAIRQAIQRRRNAMGIKGRGFFFG